jgi:hypothetical protein
MMTDGVVIRQRVRALLAAGELPCEEPQTTWAGLGTGRECAACAEAIAASEVEYEVDSAGTTLRLHRLCHEIWRAECAAVRP